MGGSISKQGIDFVRSLLTFDPEARLSAEAAMQHPWIVQRLHQTSTVVVGQIVVDAMRRFSHAPTFFRCCMEMMAWSLTKEERAKVREYFLAMDQNHQGTIMLWELKSILQKFCVPDEE